MWRLSGKKSESCNTKVWKLCCKDAKVVSQKCESCVATMWKLSCKDVKVVLQTRCESCLAKMWKLCCKDVKVVLQRCESCVAKMWKLCGKGVKITLRVCDWLILDAQSPNYCEDHIRAKHGIVTYKLTSQSLIHCSWHAVTLCLKTIVENGVEWTGKAEMKKAEFSPAGIACKSTFWHATGVTQRSLNNYGFSTKGTLICGPAPHIGIAEVWIFCIYIKACNGSENVKCKSFAVITSQWQNTDTVH